MVLQQLRGQFVTESGVSTSLHHVLYTVTKFPKKVQQGLADSTGIPAHAANKTTVNGTFSLTWLAHLLLRKLIVEIKVGSFVVSYYKRSICGVTYIHKQTQAQ